MAKRLYRSKNNSMLAGVCGGIAEYFNADPTVVRLLAVLLLLVFNIGAVIAYLIMIIVVPLEDTATPTMKQ